MTTPKSRPADSLTATTLIENGRFYVIICHCTDCQGISGAPYRASVPVKCENFKLRGDPKTYVKTADSGNKMALAFCGDCGSALYSGAVEKPAVFNLRLGAVKQRAQLAPKAQYWCRSAMPWVMDINRLPQADQDQPLRPSTNSN
jgi:hypothetical protein